MQGRIARVLLFALVAIMAVSAMAITTLGIGPVNPSVECEGCYDTEPIFVKYQIASESGEPGEVPDDCSDPPGAEAVTLDLVGIVSEGPYAGWRIYDYSFSYPSLVLCKLVIKAGSDWVDPIIWIDADTFLGPTNTSHITFCFSESANSCPIAYDDEYSISCSETLVVGDPGVLGNDVDPDGDPLTAELVDTVGLGTLYLYEDGSFTYVRGPQCGVVTFTYKAFDGICYSNVAAVTITVTDTTDPWIVDCPATPIDLGCNPERPTCDAAKAQVSADDDCTLPQNLVWNCVAGPITGDCHQSQTFTLTVTDECDNVSVPCDVTFTWKVDTTNPWIVACPATPIDLGCNPEPPTCDDAKAQVSADDDCTLPQNLVWNCEAGPITGDCHQSQTFTLAVTDECDNVSVPCDVTFTWKDDTTAPELIGELPEDQTVDCATGLPQPPVITALDACDGPLPVIFEEEVDVDCPCEGGSITWLWRAVDECGNLATRSHTIVVEPVPSLGPFANDDAGAYCAVCPTVPIHVLANDTGDFDPDSLEIVSDPPSGTATINADHTVTYIADPGFSGLDSFRYEICNECNCDQATVRVVVTPDIAGGGGALGGSRIVISEIYPWGPEPLTGRDFVEFVNTSGEPIYLPDYAVVIFWLEENNAGELEWVVEGPIYAICSGEQCIAEPASKLLQFDQNSPFPATWDYGYLEQHVEAGITFWESVPVLAELDISNPWVLMEQPFDNATVFDVEGRGFFWLDIPDEGAIIMLIGPDGTEDIANHEYCLENRTWWFGKFTSDTSRSIERLDFMADEPEDWQLGIGLSSFGINFEELPLIWTSGILGEGRIPWTLLPESVEVTATWARGDTFTMPSGDVAEHIPDLPIVVLAERGGDLIEGAATYVGGLVEVDTADLEPGTYILWVIRAPSVFRVTAFEVQ